jgi:O-antigen/teichoic acid export membrane protein
MIRKTLRSTTITGLILSAPMLLPMLLTPQYVLAIFSDTVSEGGYLLQISAVGQIAMIVCGAGGFVLTMSGHEAEMRNAATGAAISSSLSLIVLNLVSSHRVLRHFGFHPLLLILKCKQPEKS